MRQIVLDTETTGLDPKLGHKVIEIGAIVIQDRQITQETFHTYINPERDSDPGALAVHGLSRSFLENKPTFSEILGSFLEFLTRDGKKSELIIHNAKFDISFLNAEIALCNQSLGGVSSTNIYQDLNENCSVIDSLKLARELHPNQRNSLDALCKRYNIDNSHRSFHGALLDAQLLAQVYLKMTSGQSSFFDRLTAVAPVTQDFTAASHRSKVPVLPIHYASSEELQAHEDRLTAIHKQAGTCAWKE